jgi:hypothetical protein
MRKFPVQWGKMLPVCGFGLIAICAGCWEKIEYQDKGLGPAGAQTSETPSTPEVAASSNSKANNDRYATPPATSEATSPSLTSQSSLTKTDQQPSEPQHTDAPVVSPAVEVATPGPNTRLAAWRLGSRLSLAALANDRGVTTNVTTWLEEARSAAKSLDTSVTDLPAPANAAESSAASPQVLNYLSVEGRRIGRDLSAAYGANHAALFEVALKSNLLILLYSPRSTTVEAISAAIRRAAPQAGLPTELWQPLVDLLGKDSSINDVRTAERKLHSDVEQYLANAAEPGKR